MIKKLLSILFCFLFLHYLALAQTNEYVSNIQVQQQGQYIVVNYDLAPLPNLKSYYKVALSVTLDGKIISPKSVSGDVGAKKVTAGSRQIRWNVFQDVPELVGDLNVVVLAEAFIPKARSSFILLGGFLSPSFNRIALDDGDIQTYRFANQSVSLDKSSSLSLDMGVSATYFLNKTFGVGLQLGRTSYQTTLKADNLNISYSATDADGDSHTRQLTIRDLEEKLTISSWSITPHISLLQKLSERLQLHTTVGLQLGLSASAKQSYQGIFTSQNEYAEGTLTDYPVTLYAVDSDQNGLVEPTESAHEYFNLYTNWQARGESEPLEPSNPLALQLSVGLLYQLGANLHLGVRPQLSIGFGNSFEAQQDAPDNILLKEYNDYRTLTGASSKSTRSGLGLQIGVFYRL